MKPRQPIRVFFSPLSCRFYASRNYRLSPDGSIATVSETGRDDVTNDIAELIELHNIAFRLRDDPVGGS